MARADQGSCRRCHRDLPGCSCGGSGHPRRSTRLRRGRDPGGADRISALHDDLLLQILNRLGCAAAAAQTGLLSRRWRGLWTRLPELVLRGLTPRSLHAELARLVAAFEFDPRPRLQLLDVRARWYCSFSRAQFASLFDAAARLQPENLAVEARAPFPVTVMLPRLDGTRSLTLDVHGDGVNLISHQELEELVLSATEELRRVVIVAPRLKKLRFRVIEGVLDDFSLCYMAQRWRISHDNALATRHMFASVIFGPQGS